MYAFAYAWVSTKGEKRKGEVPQVGRRDAQRGPMGHGHTYTHTHVATSLHHHSIQNYPPEAARSDIRAQHSDSKERKKANTRARGRGRNERGACEESGSPPIKKMKRTK